MAGRMQSRQQQSFITERQERLHTQTKTNTKTNNPVEPQTNIVQESRKRKGEELPHLAKRTQTNSFTP